MAMPKPSFRPATKADAATLAVLVDIAGEGMPSFMWSTLKAPGQSVLEFGRERARRDTGGFSYKNAVIAEIGCEVAAALVGYRLDDPYDLEGSLTETTDFVQPLVRLEAKAPSSWYVNVLATFPEFRHRGIGGELLVVAKTKAREAGAPALSVIVGSWNDDAARLYVSAGYSKVASEPAILFPGSPHEGDWVWMIKSLKETA
jgi:ribosomal protein S18 acetylase RimI-like enzyme